MDSNYFIKEKLDDILSKEETNILIKKMINGDKNARNKLIEKNIRLVMYVISTKYSKVNYDKNDLFQIGCIGLTKAIDNYDITKNYKLSGYAYQCIYNEICDFVRKLNKEKNTISFDEPINKTNTETILDNTIDINNNLEDIIITKEINFRIRNIINDLPYPSNKIISLYFGFENDIRYNQSDISNLVGLSQSQISRILKRTLKNIKQMIIKENLVETHSLKYFKNSI